MVQRQSQSKPGVVFGRVIPGLVSGKSKTAIGSCPSGCSDGKARRGPDLKKMKRSGSIKRSNGNSLRPFPFSVDVSQPGKPPPLRAMVTNSAAETPQKQPRVRQGESLPNYMKPTSSSDARKGSSVSTLSIQINSAPESKTPLKNPVRSSSLRLVRTLTKAPSFKPAISSQAKRCSQAALCTNMKVQRATCSSTLKDSKFPEYLTLSHGATEAEGTSAMKVCPYTYCSLNGHCHAPLLPLKCFISSRRRAMKATKNLGLEALKTDTKEPIPTVTPTSMKAEDSMDYIKIYAETEAIEGESENHEEINYQGADDSEVSKGTVPVEYFQGDDDSEVEGQKSIPQSLDMEWGGHHYSIFEINQVVEQPAEVQQEEYQACNGLLPEERILEISELSQLSHCFSYDQYSSLEEDEMKEVATDAEEVSGSLTVGLSSESAEKIKTDPIIHQQSHDEGSAITDFSCNQELESSSDSQHPPGEKEKVVVDEFNGSDDIDNHISQTETQDLLSAEELLRISDVDRGQTLEISDGVDEDKILVAFRDCSVELERRELVPCTESSIAEEANVETSDSTREKLKSKYTRAEINSKQCPDRHENRIGKNRCKELNKEEDIPRSFNPRDPNFLPIVPDEEAEKVDLRHQTMDERRNSEEWMIDYALRKAVTRLEPARKRKVALLVEAFEKVMPIPKVMQMSKWDTHLTSPRSVQACS
ncbi:hypothetical protein SAY86_010977 [Trapa natans]|uniref:Calmodulin-binding domain-containing protein n=1 Tax=Trapa natans TaxID=22666 RepID=A0AAN7R0I1_TRANT|nr:hypothetical protein SAY86_010977 [Trapa natans]